MPIYEYQCTGCGQVEERWQKFSDAPLTTCPVCGGEMTKLISNCAFHLKGGGWYVSDYGNGSRPNSAPGDSPKDSEGTAAAPAGDATAAAAPAKPT